MKDRWTRYEYRKLRVRNAIRAAGGGRPRLCVRRSLNYIYAQVVDDVQGKTLAFASSVSKDFRNKFKSGKTVGAARAVGELLAGKALEAGVRKVVFDRGGMVYHGRVKALADGARAGGLEF